MKFTIVKNSEGNLAKTMKSDGTKMSSAHMSSGTYEVKEVNDLKAFNTLLDDLESNEAITLGIPTTEKGSIVSKDKLDVSKGIDKNTISRSKEHFTFGQEAIVLFDIDTDDGENVECKSYDDVLKILCELDPQFKDAEVLARHSSSSFIYKWNKGTKEELKGAGSYHVYVKMKHTNTDLDTYVKALENRAFECGYGYFKVSKSGAMLKRQVFDGAVFSPERLVFEAGMLCEEPYEQERPKAYYKNGGFIDCRNAPSINTIKVNEAVSSTREKKQPEADGIRQQFTEEKVKAFITEGCTPKEAKQKVERLLEDSVLPTEWNVTLSDGNVIKVQDIFTHPQNYDKQTCSDPLEPEKGKGKAIIYANEGLRPLIHSFAHGGVKYTLEVDYDTIYKIAEQAYTGLDVKRIKKLLTIAKLSNDERKKIATVLKNKHLLKSINDLDISEQELVTQREEVGYVDISDKGKIHPTIGNLRALMGINEMTYSYDVILKNADIRHPDIHQGSPNREEAIVSTISTFAYNAEISPKIVDHLSALANSDYSNPLLEFAKMSYKNYDGSDYIGQVCKTLTADVSDLYRKEILTKWFTQCIAAWDYERTSPREDAKAKFESVLVFQGKQGVEKTKFFDALLPKAQGHYIKTSAMLNPADKDSLMQNTSYGIVELGELESTFNKSDIGALKAFLSNSLDEYRVPYGRTASKNKRCTSFCASVNESGFLRDPTGARRFWIVPVQSIDLTAFEKIDKAMLWAQAYGLYKNGAKWWFDATDTKVNTELDKLHNVHTAYSLADEVLTEIKEFNTNAKSMTVTEIFEKWSNSNVTKKDKNDLSAMLEREGYKRDSRKKFMIPTEYKYPINVPISTDEWSDTDNTSALLEGLMG